MPENLTYIFTGITGSVAYGLATPDSDVDKKGVFVFRTEELLGLDAPEETVTSKPPQPDFQAHEIGKFFRLALACNPTILEMMFLPGDCIEHEDGVFTYIKNNSDRFLFEKGVRDSFGGYAKQQLVRIQRRMATLEKEENPTEVVKRVKKHARHCFRLFDQGVQLLETGSMNIRVTPARREELFTLGELPYDELERRFDLEMEKFNAITSGLPEKPDRAWVNDLLIEIRRMYV